MSGATGVEIVEVGPRDGFQSIAPFIPTARKIDILQGLYDAGVRRVEATSFVSSAALPQLADAADILVAIRAMPAMDAQVLAPTARQAERALAADAGHIAFVLSVSKAHNQSNVRRDPARSVEEYAAIAAMAGDHVRLRLNVATAFDCPFEGPVAPADVLELLRDLVAIAPHAEVALCDTTGRVTPQAVAQLFTEARSHFPQVKSWAFHGHDTFGMGAANALAAWKAGIRCFDASIAGLGGCPFAPGATGNVATEDLVWMFEGMDIGTGIDLARLDSVARDAADIPGAQTGGRVRLALAAARKRADGRGADV